MTQALATSHWHSLTDYLHRYFHRPDYQALACVLACTASHYYLDYPPVWLFIVGPSSSGKTRICVDSLSGLNNICPMGDITAKTFLSGNTQYRGLLSEIGAHAILTFKDFTTILSKREDERGEIASQLREIYDGKFTKRTGMGPGDTWYGKITVIAGATTALERAWAIKRELGERFLIVRWPTTSDYTGLKIAASQRGRDPEVNKELERRVMQVVHQRAPELPTLPEKMLDTIAAFSQILARMRGQVYRDREQLISDHPTIEDSYRIHKQLCTIAAAHAALWHREPQAEDLAIAERVALDSIPLTRRLVFNALLTGASISTAEISTATELPWSTAAYHLQDLQALKVAQTLIKSATETVHSFHPDFAKDIHLAGLGYLHKILPPNPGPT